MSSLASAETKDILDEDYFNIKSDKDISKPEHLIDFDSDSYLKLPSDLIIKFLGGQFVHDLIPTEINGEHEIKDTLDQTNQMLSQREHKYRPIPLYNRVRSRSDKLITLQKWEGSVVEVNDHVIIADLVDLTEEGNEEVAEIPIIEISDSDKGLLQKGSIFYWYIGYRDSLSGQRERVSIIRFRRLPMWTERDIKQSKDKASKLIEKIQWDDSETPITK